jgi:hypothetical protein
MMEMSASEASPLRELCTTETTAPGKCTALKARSSTINGGSTNSGIACTEAAELPSTEPTSGYGGATPGANRTASMEAATAYCTATKSASTSAVKPSASAVKAATTAAATVPSHRRGS